MTSAEKEQLGIQYLYRGDKLWQFRIAEGTPDYHTKSFSDSGRPSDASLADAQKYREEYLNAHPELRDARPILRVQLQKNNRTGIIGVNYSERRLPSGTMSCEWQMTCPRPGGGTARTAKFSVNKFGETRALMMAVEARREATREYLAVASTISARDTVNNLIEEYDDIIAELNESLEKDKGSELLAVIKEARLDATSKRSEINVRLGQHRFRRMVLARWNSCCAATGADIFINASHIKPWRDSSNFDRINPDNGIALSPLYDKAFDQGYISFADNGALLVADKFRERLLRLGMNLEISISGLTEDYRPFLQYHRQNIFKQVSC